MQFEYVYPDPDALFTALHKYCVKALQTDLETEKKVSCYLSGGTTPLPLYGLLARSELPWQRICPALVDERWVAIDDAASNEGMLRKHFSQQADFLTQLTGMKTAQATAREAEPACNERYAALPKPVSFCLLGMGSDGHTASLFPHAQGLTEALQTTSSCKSLTALPSAVTGSLTERMSLSLAGILQAKRIALLITGKQKWEIYQKALHCSDKAAMPVSAVLQQKQAEVDVFYCP